MICNISPYITTSICGGMYQRAINNPLNTELSKCIKCGKGKSNIDVYVADHRRLLKEGLCECCGREVAISKVSVLGIEGKYLCLTCKRGAKSAIEYGIKYEYAQEEISDRANSDCIIRNKKHYWSWEKIKKGIRGISK